MPSLPPSVQNPITGRPRAARPSPVEERTDRSIWIGLLCTLLFHILLFTLAPLLPKEAFMGSHSSLQTVPVDKRKTFDFQLVNPPQPPPQANPFKFVETNPEAPANEPDKTDNFSNRNQQSAQAEAAKEKDPENRPSVKGQDEIKNDSAIVSGEHAQPQQGAAGTPTASQNPAEQQQNAQQARAEQIPLEGNEKKIGESKDGIGMSASRNKAASTNADQLVEGSRESKSATGDLTASPEHASRPQPKPRPRLTAARSTILTNRIQGTPNIGLFGIDARWSEHGDYLNELIEVVDASWHKIVEASSVRPKPGTHVAITFRVNANGEVVIQSVEETTGTLGVNQCTTAITTPQPYRKWTEQMIAVLGKEQTIGFVFYYE